MHSLGHVIRRIRSGCKRIVNDKLWEMSVLGIQEYCQLECGLMPNVMAALPNIGGALCSTPQFG